MGPEIPNPATPGREISNLTQYARTIDLECAAALLTEEGIEPFPDKANFIRHLRREKKGKPFFEFRFAASPVQKLICQAFHDRDAFLAKSPEHPIARVIQCFDSRRLLRHRLDIGKPVFDPAFTGFYTRDLKTAATILAVDAALPLPGPEDFIRRKLDVRPSCFVFQFEPTEEAARIAQAFANAADFVKANREDWLAYVVRAFYLRERLLDRINDPASPIPVLRITKQSGGGKTTIVTVPEKPKQGASTHV